MTGLQGKCGSAEDVLRRRGRIICTDEAERSQRFPDETRDLTLISRLRIMRPATRPRSSMDRTARAREPENFEANAPVHASSLPEEERRITCTDGAERSQRFPVVTRDLTLISDHEIYAPPHAPVVQWIEQRGQESPRTSRRTRQFKRQRLPEEEADHLHRRSGAQSTVSG